MNLRTLAKSHLFGSTALCTIEDGADADVSISDALSAAFDADEAGQAGQAGTPPAAAPAPAQATAPAPAAETKAPDTPEQAAERARDATGKFAKAPEAPAAKTIIDPAKPEAGAELQLPAETIVPPAAWSPAAKAAFANADPIIQQEALKREKDWEAGTAQRNEQAQRFNRLDSILAPRRERFALAGLDETQAVQALFAAQDFLERDARGGLLYLCRQYGVHPQTLLQAGGQAPAQAEPIHPQLQAVLQEFNALKGVVTQQQQTSSQAALAQANSHIDQFRADPKNIYFENVKKDMAVLITSNQAKDLQDAYDKAIWASPEIRPLLLQAQQTAAAKAAQDAAAAKVAAAKAASGSVTGSPAPGSSGGQGQTPANLRDALSQAWDQAVA